MHYTLYTSTPRGAVWAAEGAFAFGGLLSYAVSKLKGLFKARPTGAEACKNVAELTAYANSVARSEPGFSADILAAIARQE